MQIVVNTRLLLKNRLEGIGWFTMQTLSRITAKNKDVHFVFLFDRDFDESFIFSDNVTPLIIGPKARHPLLYYIWFEHSVKTVLNKLQPDLFLSPDGFLSLAAKCKQLPVIHDINFLHHPSDSKWLTSRYYNYYFPKFAAKANRIATVSEFSKSDISENYHIDRNKIDVVYNGINSEFRVLNSLEKSEAKSKFSRAQDYFICVGSLHPRKNIPTLIKAFEQFKKNTAAPHLLLLTGPAFWGTEAINELYEKSEYKNDIIFTGRLNPNDLSLALGAAAALCFVSYYEGFGIPLVEAMAAGTPIICSNTTSLPEIAGEAAIKVNPFDANEIALAMQQIVEKTDFTEHLILKGLERSKEFSWDRSSNLLWESIQKTISNI